MILINKYNNVQISLKESLIEQLGKIAIKHFPNEFGGFLMGKYSKDLKSVAINDFILPKKYKSTPSLFERYIIGIEDIFLEKFESKGIYYIGEWHSHPNGSCMYSNTDLDAMRAIVQCSTVHINNPILLILSIDNKSLKDFKFYCYCDKALYNYE